ncbi:MAG: DUF1203 domain-containing protein [Croceibacterium sp.]
MTYSITGLDPAKFTPLFSASDAELEQALASRVTATSDSGFPCRVSLVDASAGEELILVHHVSNDVAKPFRMAHAIYVRAQASAAPVYRDAVPPTLAGRTLGLRAFSADGMMRKAALAQPGAADAGIRQLLDDPAIAYVHAHNAAYGCFLAAVERD